MKISSLSHYQRNIEILPPSLRVILIFFHLRNIAVHSTPERMQRIATYAMMCLKKSKQTSMLSKSGSPNLE